MDRRPEDRIALIELVDRDGRVRRAVDVHAWPVSLGRAIDNTIVLDDPHVAAHHATLLVGDDGQLRLQAGHSVNGVTFGKQRLPPGGCATLAPDTHWLLGTQRLRVRLAGDLAAAVAPEQPLALPALGNWSLAGLGAAWLTWQVLQRWVLLDPGADLEKWLPWLLGLPAGVAVWSGAWALGSKLFRHGFEFTSHAAIALSVMLGFEVADVAVPHLAAVFDWPLLSMVWLQWGVPLAAAVLIRAHLLQLLPHRRRTVQASVLALLTASMVVTGAVNWRQQGRLLSQAYMPVLPVPALRWGPVSAPAILDADLLRLREALNQRVKQSADEAPDDDLGEH